MKKNYSSFQSATATKRAWATRLSAIFGMAIAGLLFAVPGSMSLQASDLVGVYALVDKVVLAPNNDSPETAQVWGVFALSEGRGDTYAKPKRGYLFFKVDPEKPEVTRKEWNDLKELAGTRQCVAFGSRYPKQKPTVRASNEKPKDPDMYALHLGVRKIRDTDYAPVKALLSVPPAKEDKATGEKKQ